MKSALYPQQYPHFPAVVTAVLWYVILRKTSCFFKAATTVLPLNTWFTNNLQFVGATSDDCCLFCNLFSRALEPATPNLLTAVLTIWRLFLKLCLPLSPWRRVSHRKSVNLVSGFPDCCGFVDEPTRNETTLSQSRFSDWQGRNYSLSAMVFCNDMKRIKSVTADGPDQLTAPCNVAFRGNKTSKDNIRRKLRLSRRNYRASCVSI